MCCSVLPPEIIMHDAYISGRSENNIKCVVVHNDLGWKNQTTRYNCRFSAASLALLEIFLVSQLWNIFGSFMEPFNCNNGISVVPYGHIFRFTVTVPQYHSVISAISVVFCCSIVRGFRRNQSIGHQPIFPWWPWLAQVHRTKTFRECWSEITLQAKCLSKNADLKC